MLEVCIAADTDLGQRAIEAVENYVRQHAEQSYHGEEDWPIARSQIAGLRQIAANEPSKVAEFAEKQRSRAEKRLEGGTNEQRQLKLEAEIAFWELVKTCCDGKPPKVQWSLNQERDRAIPAELQDEKQPSGAQLTKEQQAARKERRQRREAWQKQWERDHYAAFFQRFCIHYFYEMSKRTQGG